MNIDMKKILAIFGGTFGILFSAIPVFAQIGSPCNSGVFNLLCNLGQSQSQVGKVIGAVVNIMFVVAAIIALIYLVIGGIKWVTSEGDSKNVEAARNQIIAAAVGLGITFLSYFILNLLLTFLLGKSFSDISIPTLGQ